jgi:hypothetical protein
MSPLYFARDELVLTMRTDAVQIHIVMWVMTQCSMVSVHQLFEERNYHHLHLMAALWACEKLGLRTLLNFKLTVSKVSVCTDEYIFSLEQYHNILRVIGLVHCTVVFLCRTYLKSNSVRTLPTYDNYYG